MSFDIHAVVEIPLGSMYKYEVDKDSGRLAIDRPLPSPLPYNYGYVPNTLHGDGDPLDICLLGVYPIPPLCEVKVVVLGALLCDDNGDSDDKIVAHVVGEKFDPILIHVMIESVRNYLSTYKSGFTVKEFVGPDEAIRIVMKDIDRFYEQDN